MNLKDRNSRICALVSGGMTYAQVALHLGLSRSVVAGAVFRAGACDPQSPHSNRVPRRCSLPDSAVREIRRRRARGEKVASLASEYGISDAHVYHVTSGNARAYVQ